MKRLVPPAIPASLANARGQAALLVVGVLCAALVAAFVLGAVARGVGVHADAQRAADLGALAGARAMHAEYPRLFEPATIRARPNPRHLERDAYLEIGRSAARRVASLNGAGTTHVRSPDGGTFAPVRIEVTVHERVVVRRGEARRSLAVAASATAELAPVGADGVPLSATGPGYTGPLATRQGKPMRPDVAQAFDRLSAAASGDGVHLIVTSGYRSDAEQAVLFARHPDPKWVAPPGRSLHRYGTELDLGPPAAYAWLQRNAPRFHFEQRYEWEAWHWGYELNAASRPGPTHVDGESPSSMPQFVPPAFEAPIADAAQRWNVSAALLSAQLYAESNFNPFARSPAGAQGIAQFMPGTAHAYGLRNPFDAERAIGAQAHLMRDLLREFASVPLALAAYNAGPKPVRACGCVPPFAETRGYVARILGLMSGAGELTSAGAPLAVRLVR